MESTDLKHADLESRPRVSLVRLKAKLSAAKAQVAKLELELHQLEADALACDEPTQILTLGEIDKSRFNQALIRVLASQR